MGCRMVIKPTKHSSGRKVLASVAKEQRKAVDKEAILIRKLDDPASLSQQENARIRGQSRKEAARRRAGLFGAVRAGRDGERDVGARGTWVACMLAGTWVPPAYARNLSKNKSAGKGA